MATYTFYGYSPSILTTNGSTWTLNSSFNHMTDRVVFTITDDDSTFDGDGANNEVGEDNNQTATVTKPDGTSIASGRIYDEQYFGITKPGGGSIWIERVEIGGTHVGYIVSEPLVPGTTYNQFETNDVTGGTELSYSALSSVPCFAAGSLIATPSGERPIEQIVQGDRVIVHDGEPAEVIWTGKRNVSPEDLATNPKLVPIRIPAGAFGLDRPKRDLCLSRQHRVLVSKAHSPGDCELEDRVSHAISLLGNSGIELEDRRESFSYHHVLFGRHHLILAEGLWCESLYPGSCTMEMLGRRSAFRVAALLGPRLATYRLVRPALPRKEARQLFGAEAG